MPDSVQILLVEDDENLQLALEDNLTEEGYTVTCASTGSEALDAIARQAFDLLVLDIMLPDGIDGYQICRELRASGSSAMVLMLTARTLEEDLLKGFEVGADDYLSKPYRLRELLARIKALLARAQRTQTKKETQKVGEITVDFVARQVWDRDQRPIDLTRTEFDLLTLFLKNEDRALSRNEILDEVWGRDVVVDTRTVDNFVSSLKKKLRWNERAGFTIKAVRGVGYRMELQKPV